jgi:hypothetical protein
MNRRPSSVALAAIGALLGAGPTAEQIFNDALPPLPKQPRAREPDPERIAAAEAKRERKRRKRITSPQTGGEL